MTPKTDEKTPVWKDVLWVGFGVSLGSMFWIAYQWNVRNEATLAQRQVEAQYDDFVTQLQPLKDKIQGIRGAQSRTDAEIAKLAEQSVPSKIEIQGLQNHVTTTLVRQQQKK